MKSIFFIIAFFTGFCISAQIKVATIDARGTVTVTEDFQQVKDHFNKILRMNNVNVVLQNVIIKSERIDAREDDHFYAYGSNKENTVKIAHALKFANGMLYFDKTYNRGTVICSGCSEGCSPKLAEDGYFFCTTCIEGTSCEKSSTVTSP